jgi:tellurite resistance protein
MANSNLRSITTPIERKLDRLNYRDDEMMHALVTAGALVAVADGQVQAVERGELVNFVDRRGFVSTISRHEIAETFDVRVRQLEERRSAEVIVENFRPLAGLSLASVVVRTAERVAAADRRIHPSELGALKLIRLVMISLPTDQEADTGASSVIGPIPASVRRVTGH